MRQILAMTRKEFLLWAQKPGSWLVVFILPLIFIWFFYSVFGTTASPEVTVYAVNADNGLMGEQVLAALSKAENLEIEVLGSREEADERVGAGERMAAIVVPLNFTDTINTPEGAQIEIIVDPARAELASLVRGLVNAALAPMIVDAEINRGVEASVRQIMRNLRTPEGTAVTGTPEAPGAFNDSPFPQQQNTPNPLFDPGTSTPTGDNPFSTGFSAQDTPEPDDPFGDPFGGPIDDPFGNPLGETATVTPTGPASAAGTGEPTGGEPANGGTASGGLEIDEDDPIQQFLIAAYRAAVSSQVKEAIDDPQVQLQMEAFGGQDPNQPTLLDSLVPGYSLMFVFFLLSSLAVTVVEERQLGTLRRLLIAPVPRSRILLGKMLPYFVIAVVQFIFVFAVSRFVFGLDLGSSPMALVVMVVTSSLVMVCLGILIASLARSQGQADGMAIILILALAIVSGAMFPNISIPGLQNLTPHYWAIQGFMNVLARGQGIEGVLLPAGILLTMAAAFFTVGAVRFHFE